MTAATAGDTDEPPPNLTADRTTASAADPTPSTTAVAGAVTVHAFNESTGREFQTRRLAQLAAEVLRSEGASEGELGLRFVNPGAMRHLNSIHMGTDRPTDVLAFPIDGMATDRGKAHTGDRRGRNASHASTPSPAHTTLIGDVVVCPRYAATQASGHAGDNHDGSLADELELLVVHGVLHVCGYDHADSRDAQVMQARQCHHLAAHRNKS